MNISIASHTHCCHPTPRPGPWPSDFSNCCHRILGPAQHQMAAFIMGGFVGQVLGLHNPMLGMMAGLLAGLMGQMDGHSAGHCCHHHQHQGAASYPPLPNQHFGSAMYGGFNFRPGSNLGRYGQPHWCCPQRPIINFNFNFGHYGPQRNCWRRPQHRPRCHPRPIPPRPRPRPRPRPCPKPRRDGRLSQEGKGKPICYTTSGGYKVQVNKHTISVTDPSGKNTVKHWGDPHENLNGKHLKDWKGKHRTMVLGDGTKITMGANGPQGVTNNTSIYDGRQNVQINNKTNTVTHHGFNHADTRRRDRAQYDGETAVFKTGHNGTGIYTNIYNQDENFRITRAYERLGRSDGQRVEDFYDDPRLRHT